MKLKFQRLRNSPLGAVIKVILAVLGGEFLIMAAIEGVLAPIFDIKASSEFWEYLDPVMLSFIVTPVLYYSVLRPMKMQQARLELQKTALEETTDKLRKQKEHQDSVFEVAMDAIVLMNSNGTIIGWSGQADRLFGWRQEEVLGKLLHEVIIPVRDRENHVRGLKHFLTTGNGPVLNKQIEVAALHREGWEFPVELSIVPLNTPDGYEFSSFIRDISERKRAEEGLRVTASVFKSSQEAILITDANNIIVDVNPAFTKITGYSHHDVVGKTPNILSSGRQGKDFYEKMWNSLHVKKRWRGEIWNKRKNGEVYPEQLSITTICDDDGKVIRHVAVFSDISKIKEHEAQLNHIAHFDALTGIPNRVLLADRMKQAISQTSREKTMMAVCYLDLDGFKPINDTLGHKAGDQVLIEIADRIGSTIRGGDTVARLGGDEFVVLLLGQDKGEESVATVERLLLAISQPIDLNGKICSVSASIGVSIYPLDDEDPDTLLRHADQAMYVAKQSGKNRFYIYDPELDKRARNQNDFLKSIRIGLEENQFELYYQPKINLISKKFIGAEALIRWRHPERGLLSPAEFLHIIENTDLDIMLGEWVISAALAQMQDWRSSGMSFEISINISGYHLESSGFVEKLLRQLGAYPDLPRGNLQIEILETVALKDITIVREIIESCRKLGIGFALDDFGTGYSSLSYLSSLPVDTLKIDQSFVRDMLEDKGDRAIVQGIIALAHAFDRKTVAEGIETRKHYQTLLDMGCEVGQGYYIARPMQASELLDWASAHNI